MLQISLAEPFGRVLATILARKSCVLCTQGQGSPGAVRVSETPASFPSEAHRPLPEGRWGQCGGLCCPADLKPRCHRPPHRWPLLPSFTQLPVFLKLPARPALPLTGLRSGEVPPWQPPTQVVTAAQLPVREGLCPRAEPALANRTVACTVSGQLMLSAVRLSHGFGDWEHTEPWSPSVAGVQRQQLREQPNPSTRLGCRGWEAPVSRTFGARQQERSEPGAWCVSLSPAHCSPAV